MCFMCPITCCVSNFKHREAEGFKEQGNAFYLKKDYAEAYNYYTKAIGNLSTNCTHCHVSPSVDCRRLT